MKIFIALFALIATVAAQESAGDCSLPQGTTGNQQSYTALANDCLNRCLEKELASSLCDMNKNTCTCSETQKEPVPEGAKVVKDCKIRYSQWKDKETITSIGKDCLKTCAGMKMHEATCDFNRQKCWCEN